MPLPFGGKPEDSPIYGDLKTKKLSELTPDEFDSIRSRTYAEGINGLEDEYRRLLLLGLASDKLSLSGPIPNTAQIINTTVDTNNGDEEIFTPGPGEVWQVLGVGLIIGTGAQGGIAYLKVQNPSDTSNAAIISEIATAGSIESFDNGNLIAPLYIDENVKLIARYYKSGGFGGDTLSYDTLLIRVR
jgi:hypothetical protein